MTVVYLDEVFLLNGIIDYLLLLCASRLAGEPLRRPRMALAAALGGLYAAAVFLPEWAFLGHPACKLAAAAGMSLTAFGGARHLLRVSLVFLGVSAAFGGGVLALQLFFGAPAVLDLKTVLLSAAGCYGFLTLVFRRGARHTGGELAPAVLTLKGRRCRLTALVDTGNTLADPVTGKPVMVAEGEKAAGLFPAGEAPSQEELKDPVGGFEKRRGDGLRWRLLPYRAVGVEHALLLAVKVDGAVVGGQDYGPILVALAPGSLSDGGGYNALIGA
ncbi:MAG: sigma-E processing peptidase SpoIIGA [Clostridiales bacterium]|nr:sigma-E processing peptidase SpoIIGA [Clostridiales bacterium]